MAKPFYCVECEHHGGLVSEPASTRTVDRASGRLAQSTYGGPDTAITYGAIVAYEAQAIGQQLGATVLLEEVP
jgi:hypothetical protein